MKKSLFILLLSVLLAACANTGVSASAGGGSLGVGGNLGVFTGFSF
ncbi:hypothetical protein KRX11_01520 [Pasteurellaceae bacterium TAE3-ERU1]|nr:hypothetical protein [Spirabiliibacterium mucosae]MBE2898654.1 hypothetical protein [Spirabiliibacterium mucosae]MBV7387326.1 hypothetical protein [Pasteurellaceae bacterium TAE3-ERU1]